MVLIKEVFDEISEANMIKDHIESTTETKDKKELENSPTALEVSVTEEARVLSPRPQSENTNDSQAKKIFVGGLPHGLTQQELRDYFVSFGNIRDSVIIHNTETGKARGFGFVVFESYEVANEVLKKRFYMIKNKQVEIKKAIPRPRPRQRISNDTGTTFRSQQNYQFTPVFTPNYYHHMDMGAYYSNYYNLCYYPYSFHSYGSTFMVGQYYY